MALSFGYYEPLPITPRANSYILLVIGRFSQRTDMYANPAKQTTSEGTTEPLSITARGDSCIFSFANRFSRRGSEYAFPTEQPIAAGIADLRIDHYTPL